jgi:single-strand DNA-binding protein
VAASSGEQYENQQTNNNFTPQEVLMARSVNKVVLLGNVGKQPEVRNTRSGTVAELSLATNERRPDGQGGWQDHTEWHSLVAFGRTAEIIAEYVRVGTPLFIEGKLRTDSWDDTNAGVKRYWTKVMVLNLVLLSHGERRSTVEDYRADPEDFGSSYAHIPDGQITADEIPF